MGVKLGNDDTKINTGGKDRIKTEDLFELAKFPNQDFRTFRPVGDIVAVATHWFEVTVTTKEGEVKTFRTGRTCPNVSLDGTTNLKGGCGFCKVGHTSRTSYYENFIDIEEEENKPRRLDPPTKEERKSGFKTKGSKLWTPVVVMQFPPTVAETMQKLTKKNKDKKNVVRELSDPTFGRALDISRDTRKGVSPANMWNVQKSDEVMRKLTEDQQEYYLYDLNLLAKLIPTAKESMDDMKRNVPLMTQEDFDKLDLADFAEVAAAREEAQGGGKKKKSKSGNFRVEEDDEDEDDRPRKKSKRTRADDDEDEDEDDTPVRSKKRRVRDDEDEDDDEDEAPVRKKKSKKKAFKVSDVM